MGHLRSQMREKRSPRPPDARPLAKLQGMLEDLFAFLTKGATVDHICVADLRPSEVDELWACYSQFVERPREDFERTLKHASNVNLYRHATGELLGFEALRIMRLRVQGRTCVVVYTVFADVAPRARGHNFLQMTTLGRLLLLLSYYPFRRLYFVWTSSTIQSYLLVTHNVSEFWPRRDQATPVFIEELLDLVMREIGVEGWDPSRGVLFGGGRLRYREGIVDPSRTSDPDALFYAERNPGQADGDSLACLIPGSAKNMAALSAATLKRWFRYCRKRVRRFHG